MKNIKILCIAIIGLLLLASCGNNNLTDNDNNCFVFDKETQTIERYNFYKEACGSNVVIPEKIDGVDVKAIGSRAFANSHLRAFEYRLMDTMKLNNCSKPEDCMDLVNQEMQKFGENYKTIKSIQFPEGILQIGSSAFVGNPIQDIKLPKTIKSIDSKAFFLTQIKEVSIPKTADIDGDAFGKNVIINKY